MEFNKLSSIKSKKAAIELSIGTVVIIVLAMTMLILGIVLVRNIFTGAIDVADVTNNQVRQQIIEIFSEEGSNLVIQLGSDKTAKIREGGDVGNINIGSSPEGGGKLSTLGDLKFKVTVATQGLSNQCADRGVDVDDWFQINLDQKIEFDKLDSSVLFATLKVRVPDGTESCTQKFTVTVTDERTGANGATVAIDSFFVEVLQSGIFG